jgi:photosystem II stability/assembly factor-like uncharacterized protein
MYKITLFIFSFTLLISCNLQNENKPDEIGVLRKKHQEFLDHSPFNKSLELTKKERKELGVPPNKYLERQWELTMNPALGRPTPEKLHALRKSLKELKAFRRSVPGQGDNQWIERGPDNVGGRAKAVLFDPNDPTQKRVFAGGVSGGLWYNNDITDPNSTWQLTDAPENLAVTSISVDPNNSQVMYIGTGESYTHGAVNGNGIWKSTDGGFHWTNVFGGQDGEAQLVSNAELTIQSPANLQGNFLAVKAGFGPELTSFNGNFVLVDDGSSTPLLGCSALSNASDINGNIAVIKRGDCYFVDKVKNAQNAGAIGVVMINNVDGFPIVMGGTDPDVNIPSVMISQEDGQAIIDALTNGTSISGTISNNAGVEITIGYIVPGITHINDILTRNNNGITEIYATAGDAYYAEASPYTVLGHGYQGLYKSVDGGTTWNRLNLPSNPDNKQYIAFDLELAADNSIWLSTTRSFAQTTSYGAIMKSDDGSNFQVVYTNNNAGRMELAASKSNPNKFYVVYVNTNTYKPAIIKTTDAFNTTQVVNKPNGDSTPADDFTNGQSFYDLAIETDPNNDETVYIGGIDWYKSTNGGSSWTQITTGYGSTGSHIHPDQHNIAFSGSSKIIIANDGGIAYSGDGGNSFSVRINNFNTTQFYHMAVAPTTAFQGEYFMAGSQDNGTQLIENAQSGINSFTEAQGGDGAYCFFDQDGNDRYRISNYVYNQYIRLYNYATNSWKIINSENESNGDFINQEALDSNLNILYTNYTKRTNSGYTYSIARFSGLLDNISKTELTNALIDAAPTALKVSPYTTNATNLFVGLQNGKLIVIKNANQLFANYTEITGDEFVGSISDIEFGEDENTIFVTMFNYGVNNIFYTEDGGNTWHKKDGNLPDLPVNCILQNPLQTSEVIIGTDLGVWKTENFYDDNPVWEHSYNGMSSVKVTDLEMRDDYKVYAATYGRGIFSGQFDAAASIDEQSDNVKINVYPNPVKDVLYIDNQSENPISDVYLFDINGKQIPLTPANFKTLDLKALPTGNYILKIQAGDKTITKKVIKQ